MIKYPFIPYPVVYFFHKQQIRKALSFIDQLLNYICVNRYPLPKQAFSVPFQGTSSSHNWAKLQERGEKGKGKRDAKGKGEIR